MKIERIYYEELRSECINGKWQNKKIGAEVSVDINDVVSECLDYAKNYVKRNLDLENFEQKKAKEKLENIQKQIKKALMEI